MTYIHASSSRYDLIRDDLEHLRQKPQRLVFVPSSAVEYPFRLVQEAELVERLDINLKEVISLIDEVEDWPSIIKSADVLYLHGGNPLVFKEYLKEKKVWELIKNFPKTIIGLSAGSMLMSKNIILTPSNDEYTEYVIEPAYGFSDVNIYPHMNFKEILVSQTQSGDGDLRISDMMKLSEDVVVDLLSDDHFIVNHDDKLFYRGDYFYRIINREVFTLLDGEWVKLNYQDNRYDESIDKTTFERLFESFEQAENEGYLASIANNQEDFEFSFFNLLDKGKLIQQLDTPHLKTYIIDHPEFNYATLSLIEHEGRIIERFTFRTRYLMRFEKFKVWPLLLRI